ncbi:sugar transferase [Frigidibacter mobilis]|uniref:Undecaprenyl-phosphate galactosephosphotransferase n=1 Tax=Frigidibacter mobilis TaxID=1335048 RepID=A0A159Z4W3_9RHOB|nr:sugar transferase [Frigidibacter mobilis]AMY69380.1 undecaprenyl-phosphate galactosephosphotransferase [Frigidibacter mobilis]
MKHVVISDRFDHIDAAQSRVGGLYSAAPKRIFDILLAILILPVVAPVIGVLWLLTRLDGGKGFFGHTRIGRGGAAFKCWKIRTMVPDAEAKLQHYLAENPVAAAQWVREYKLDNDPRITRIGNFLRKTSLDELPQIWNVLCGEMSFVGPRPVIEAELVKYHGSEWAYLSMRPGITGLWQVSGRNDVSYDERVQLDVTYSRSMSLGADLRIILKTASAVLNRTGR